MVTIVKPVMRDGGIGSGQRVPNQLARVRYVHQSQLQRLTPCGRLQGTAEHLLGQYLSTILVFPAVVAGTHWFGEN